MTARKTPVAKAPPIKHETGSHGIIKAAQLSAFHIDKLCEFNFQNQDGIHMTVRGQLRQIYATATEIAVNICAANDDGGRLAEFVLPHNRNIEVGMAYREGCF